MPGIQLKNKREYFIPFFRAHTPSLTPTTLSASVGARMQLAADSGGLFHAPMWFHGRLKALFASISTAGAAGNSTDLKEVYRMLNGGVAAGGTTVMSADIVALDLNTTPDTIPAAGTILKASGVQGADSRFVPGDILIMTFDTSGTLGTATRPIIVPLGITVEAFASIDPEDPINDTRS